MSCKSAVAAHYPSPHPAYATLTAVVFNTSAHLHHRTPLPAGTTLAQAQRVFRNHDALLRLDPDLQHYEETTTTATTGGTGDDSAQPPNTRIYRVTDVMHALPAHLWDTTVAFTAEITDRSDGVEWVVRAPLGLVQTSLWTVERAGEGEGGEESAGDGGGAAEERWVLVEDVTIRCSRFLVGTVKAKCEENWKGTHQRWLAQLEKVREVSE